MAFDIVAINCANHADIGDGWCSCGERARDCYYLALIGPASHKWREMQLQETFAKYFDEGTT